ncbi:UNVERIFIED_CONTAM: Alpha/beta hydrolase domain-containing protein WAV2 [Sesamum latifolium]|uniref:Alpha/beta hydrolase domain-containing protein WAV2 n=1 Tax=Sesamum latifolium TaxID=2727402 RepID=A0AAW2U1A1_9LAMI
MVSYVSALLYGVGGIVVAGMALLVAFQEKLVYVPVLPGLTKSYPMTPARLRLLYEDVWLTSSDGVSLHAWFIKLFPDCRGPTILFFQENAGNIAHRLEMVRIMLQRLQCNVFLLSYRGYGASEGFPSQHGITKDAQAALDHLVQRTDIDTSKIVVFGRSLGELLGLFLPRTIQTSTITSNSLPLFGTIVVLAAPYDLQLAAALLLVLRQLSYGCCFNIRKYFHIHNGHGWCPVTLSQVVYWKKQHKGSQSSEFSSSVSMEHH